MNQTLRFGLVTLTSRLGDTEHNLRQHETWIRRAAELGAHIVGFPECSLTGYGGPSETAVALDDSALQRIRACAAETNVHVLVGLAERDGARVFSTCAVVGPTGLMGAMRKINGIPEESGLYAAGHEFPLFHIRGRSLGIAICADASVYEVPKIFALRGAEIVFCPHANGHSSFAGSPRRWQRWRSLRWQRFIADWGVYILGCNVAEPQASESDPGGRQFCGGAVALDPHGRVIAKSTARRPKDSLLLVDLPKCSNPATGLFECLRPEILYSSFGSVPATRNPGAPVAAHCPSLCTPPSEQAVLEHSSFYFAAARAFHIASTLGRYPVPPLHFRETLIAAPFGDVASPAVRLAPESPHVLGRMPLADALQLRRSRRRFGKPSLPLEKLGALLWAGYGLQSTSRSPDIYRTVPSAGGLFGLGVVVVVQNVEGLSAGAYIFRGEGWRLDRMEVPPLALSNWFQTDDVEYGLAAASIIFVARLDWVAAKYGERAYRYLLLEAGHAAQNIALAAAALDIACVPSGGYDDRRVSDDLRLVRGSVLPIHCLVLGTR